ncbi:MAG TPA: cyclic nucleotide-binding domain-containing protein, partial [Pseudobdellovibrionaceae bacterium]|nr:cyclic nucleotide-binding domain-containing protein [Pseudobdellovibrionaceae bacterium]
VICKEGDQGDSCFVIIQGSVTVSKGPKTIGVLGPGEAFGEIALFFTQGTRTATVMAQRNTSVLEIKAKDFYGMLSENLLLAAEFEKLALARSEKLQQSA